MQTKIGGTTFLETIQVKKGAPTGPPTHVSGFYDTIKVAERFEWQWRTALAFKEHPMHHVYWITYTYAYEPNLWRVARKDIGRQIDRLRNYNRRVLIPEHEQYARDTSGDPRNNSDEKMHYIIVEEEGSDHGRKHFHALVFMPYKIPLDLFNRKHLKWPHGFQLVKPLRTREAMGLAIYIAKYATKSQGRVKCSSNFGLTTITTLLSLSAFNRLMTLDLPMGQKLLRRLSLTPNYPTSRKIMSLISQVKSSTTLVPVPTLRNPPTMIGKQISGTLADNGSDSTPLSQATALGREVRFTLVKTAIAEIRTAIARKILPALSLPGIRTVGCPYPRSRSLRLEPDHNTAIWLAKSAYPRAKRARARNRAVRLGEPA